MSKYGNRYSQEFKQEAVRLLLTSGKTAKGLGQVDFIKLVYSRRLAFHWNISTNALNYSPPTGP